MREFEGKHVLVTGAAAGIGRAVAVAFAGEGALVSAVDVNGSALDEAYADEKNIHSFVCDLTNEQATTKVIETAITEHGSVDVLVNNAGSDRQMPFEVQTQDQFRELLAVNLDHHALLASLVTPAMRAAAAGVIINMTSTAWMKMTGNMTAYHTAKAGIVGLTRGLARDLGGYGIRVNAVAPGRVLTERAEAMVDEAWKQETKTLQCLPSLILPEDIADTVLWLASAKSRMVAGQTIVVDGGVV